MGRPLYPWPDGLQADAVPAVVLVNPKFPHNVGQAVRVVAAYGARQVLYTGTRMDDLLAELQRLPREERLRAYKHVGLQRDDQPLRRFGRGVVPVAVEVRDNAESLPHFVHPENAVYVFGPEDGSLGPGVLAACHRFVSIPSQYCLNLASAVATVLYDRCAKEMIAADADAYVDRFGA